MRFGPGGIPEQCEGNTAEGIVCCNELGLDAMELEFVRKVYLSKDAARKLKLISKKYNVKLSSHAPYWINLASKEEIKIKKSYHYILSSAQIIYAAGGKVVVFHAGYYMKRGKKEVYKIIRDNIMKITKLITQQKINVKIGPETAGKHSQFGTLNEVISLAQENKMVKPIIDFAHIHAVTNGGLKTEARFREIFESVEKNLGTKEVKNFHAHFSCIEYSDKGEIRHLMLNTKQPDFKLLAKVIKENGYNGTIISETPMPAHDAIRMRKIFEKI